MPGDTIWRVRESNSSDGQATAWLSRLSARRAALPPEARLAMDVDTRHVVDCILDRLPKTVGRPVSGLVLGAVQSGKTASMLAVSALAIDEGFNIVVLVSGTRVSLWRQTLDRAVRDLDGWSAEDAFERRRARIWLPDHCAVDVPGSSPASLFDVSANRLGKYLKEGRPVIAVVMKHADHLNAIRATLHRAITTAGCPLKMLVIDDEADDGSILSAPFQGNASDRFLPKWIEGLWASGPSDPRIFRDDLRVAYVAYTATPQANLLQHDHNPLSPRDFVTCIRAPGAEGAADARELPTFFVPSLFDRHIGGGSFYPPEANHFRPCVSLPASDGITKSEWEIRRNEYIGDAVRSFVVASACRLLQSGTSFSAARAGTWATRSEATAALPPIASMLFNPSSSVECQFEGELAIKAWLHDESPHVVVTPTAALGNERPTLDWTRLVSKIDRERAKWVRWLDDFRRAAEILRLMPGGSPVVAPPDDWGDVERVIVEEIVPAIRIQVVNSAESADVAPAFGPTEQSDGSWVAPDSMCTIFVAGNVMSRGLTLEGLSTTLFLRDPDAPLADTQMQMQRWFGYRGEWLQYCRVFAFADQLARFRQYHAADESLRTEILSIERSATTTEGRGVSPQVLGGRTFMPTGKVENLRKLPLAPGASPFVSGYWEGDGVDPNLKVVADLFSSGMAERVEVAGIPRGLILKRKLTLTEVADCLDGLRYVQHNPSPTGEAHARWTSLERVILKDAGGGFLFRPALSLEQRASSSVDRFTPNRCPFSIAAYLRLWHACKERAAIGLCPNDLPGVPWGHLSAVERAKRCPAFSVGIRFGAGRCVSGTPIDAVGAELGSSWRVRLMVRDLDPDQFQLKGTWGSRNPMESGHSGYLGDQYFDFHRSGVTSKPGFIGIDDVRWRAVGEDGLLLFHVVEGTRGDARLALGLCLPAGGPDQIGILRPMNS
ncbi:MAG: hypothetical protein GC172_07110 [Phycisphaera sp.]|nr:hypothetical protein [Phycisphaera sp.]